MSLLRPTRLLVLSVLLALAAPVFADGLEIEIIGLEDGPIKDNITAFVGSSWVPSAALSTNRRRQRFAEQAENNAAEAMRPFGYYFPSVEIDLKRADGDAWFMQVTVDRGPPVKVRDLKLVVQGDGSQLETLVAWQNAWPLPPGAVLDQTVWENQKAEALDSAEEEGYLSAYFVEQMIALDLETNSADLTLVVESGPRAVMGEISFDQDLVKREVLMPIPRFETGDYYRTLLVNNLRTDIWRTGYFDEVIVVEDRQLEQEPPVVHFQITASARKTDTHQGSVGFGTDSQFRGQYRWVRHRISQRGDSFTAVLGWQQRDQEVVLSGEYRLPRLNGQHEWWSTTGLFRTEEEEVDIRDDPERDPILRFNGRVNDYSLRFGRAKRRNLSDSREQIVELIYAQYLFEDTSFSGGDLPPDMIPPEWEDEINHYTTTQSKSLSVGMEWALPVIVGTGFNTTGHHVRARVFHSDDAWGSDESFTQLYLSSRWNLRLAKNWNLLLRGEVGYSDAAVDEITVEFSGQPVNLSFTQLPSLYRFKAGGSRSVRGYAFESLSDSGVGSNNVFTASAEVEYLFLDDWSGAVFFDVGNAFNDWGDMGLRRGAGVGIRWYTIAGAIRVDYAQALDYADDPWSVHITIGTPLL